MPEKNLENLSPEESKEERLKRLKSEAIEAARQIEMDPSRPIEQKIVAATLLRNLAIEKSLEKLSESLGQLAKDFKADKNKE